MDYRKTGALIARVRKEKRMTQNELAEGLHVSHTTVSKWERGVGFPDISLVEPLTEALGITVAELFRGEAVEKEMPACCESVLDDMVQVSGAEVKRQRRKFRVALIAAAALFVALASVLGVFLSPIPPLMGSYQSTMIDGHIIEVSFQRADGSFVEYIDCRLVNGGTYRELEEGVYLCDGDSADFAAAVGRSGSFLVTVPGLNGGEPVRLKKIDDVPSYCGTVYGDEEEYRALLG